MSTALFHNYRVKLVVLILAIFVWFYVITEERYEYALDVPIVVVNLHEDRVIRNNVPERATVLFEGTGKALLSLMLSPNARVVLDLSNIRYRYTFLLTPERVQFDHRDPQLAALKVIEPDTITVLLAEKSRRKLPVKPDVTVHPANGYMLVGDLQLSPDSVWVSGPKDLVDALNEVSTKPLLLDEVHASISRDVDLKPPETKLSIYPEHVTIAANIQKLTEKILTDIPIEIRNHPSGVRVESVPSTLSLTLEGGVDLLLHVQKHDIVAYVDYRHWTGNPDSELPAIVETPPGIRFRDIRPERFRLLVEKEASE